MVVVLFVLGLSMVFNTTAAEVLDRALATGTHHALIKQFLYAVLGALLAAGVWFLGYDQFLRLSGYFLSWGHFARISLYPRNRSTDQRSASVARNWELLISAVRICQIPNSALFHSECASRQAPLHFKDFLIYSSKLPFRWD